MRRLKRLDIPIVSVSHTPLDLGKNICIGKQKRSWLTLYRQLHLGLQAATTQYIHIAEHDCLYSEEHFAWKPPTEDIFYYNENNLLAQWSDLCHPELKGMYSDWNKKPRLALSQLVCNRELYLDTLSKRLEYLGADPKRVKDFDHIGEPGVSRLSKRARKYATSGRPFFLKDFLGRVIEIEEYKTFRTTVPNLDIRHENNFTGPRRGRQRTFKHPYWGKLEEVMR